MAKASEVIARLQQLIAKHGDRDIYALGYHSDYRDTLIVDVTKQVACVEQWSSEEIEEMRWQKTLDPDKYRYYNEAVFEEMRTMEPYFLVCGDYAD